MPTIGKKLHTDIDATASAAPSMLQRRLVLSRIKATERVVDRSLSEIKMHIENIENVIRFKKEDLKKMGGQVMFSKDKEIEQNLEKLEKAVDNLVNAFKQIQQLHEEMKVLSKEYGILAEEKAGKGLGFGAGSFAEEEEEAEDA